MNKGQVSTWMGKCQVTVGGGSSGALPGRTGVGESEMIRLILSCRETQTINLVVDLNTVS